MEQKQTNGMAVASLVLGIVSAVCIFFGYFAFIGIITGRLGLRRYGEEEAALWHGHRRHRSFRCGSGPVRHHFHRLLCLHRLCFGQRRFLELSCLISTAVSSIVEEHMEKRGRFLLRFFFVPIPS